MFRMYFQQIQQKKSSQRSASTFARIVVLWLKPSESYTLKSRILCSLKILPTQSCTTREVEANMGPRVACEAMGSRKSQRHSSNP